ncbi:hypothetical protein K3727_21660 (plasmid) [Rhodobacteraceae bacterium M382]|nr:hypothetical protein K3727_21660 [Rhodobacteraceae bacterium M382]
MVLGMHRSGTSSLTRVLNLMGSDLPAHMLPAQDKDNDLGFWESKPVMELNDKILTEAGSFWSGWTAVDVAAFPEDRSEDFAVRAQEVLRGEFGTSPLFVLKDPRLCRLTPFWAEALKREKVTPAFVLPIRNPLEVADSLQVRNHFPRSAALLAWLRHVLDAERSTRGHARVVTRYDSLLEDWRACTARIARTLDIQWPVTAAQAAEKIDGFLSPRWRHHTIDDQRLFEDETLLIWVRDVFDIMARWARDDYEDTDEAKLDQIRAAFDLVAPTFDDLAGAIATLTRENKQSEQKLTNLSTKLEAAQSSVSATTQAREAAETALAQTQAQAQADLAERDAALAERAAALDTSRAAEVATAQAREAAETALAQMQAQAQADLAERDAALAERDAALEASRAAEAATAQALEAAQTALVQTRTVLADRDAALAGRDAALAERDAALEASRTAEAAMAQAREAAETALAQAQVQAQADLAERDAALETSRAAEAATAQAREAAETALAQAQTQAQADLAERDAVLAERDAVLAERDATLAERDATLETSRAAEAATAQARDAAETALAQTRTALVDTRMARDEMEEVGRKLLSELAHARLVATESQAHVADLETQLATEQTQFSTLQHHHAEQSAAWSAKQLASQKAHAQEVAARAEDIARLTQDLEHQVTQMDGLKVQFQIALGAYVGVLDARMARRRMPVGQSRRTQEAITLLNTSGLFDAPWYVSHYTDVGETGLNPALHFICFGHAEGRFPSPGVRDALI